MKSVILLSLLSLALAKQIVNFKNCGGDTGAKINAIICDPCQSEPCQLKRGTTYNMHVNFTANEASVGAKTVVHGIIKGVELPFMTEDACAKKEVGCPVAKGETQVYNDTILCSPLYPKVELVAKWMLQDNNGGYIFCFDLPLIIVDG